MKKIISISLVCLISLSFAYKPETKRDNNWSAQKTPTQASKPSSIGSYANGCISGAVALPSKGDGFYDMRRNRGRYFGHPKLIDFITELGQFVDRKYSKSIMTGDLSQARGGKMNFGHSSHRIGLDVDVWMQILNANEKPYRLRDMQTTISKSDGRLLANKLKPEIRDALYFSATHKNVARIFVNPVIKASLCETEADRSWLRKLRPWWGHHEHFHVRLNCPSDSPLCKNQASIPAGSGCNEGLYNWVDKQSDIANGVYIKPPRTKPRKPRPPKILPEQCLNVLTQ